MRHLRVHGMKLYSLLGRTSKQGGRKIHFEFRVRPDALCLVLNVEACVGSSTRRMVQAALQKRGAEARSALVWAAVMGDAEAAVALLGRGGAWIVTQGAISESTAQRSWIS